MCGISAIFGDNIQPQQLEAMVAAQNHRGPDSQNIYLNLPRTAGLGHNRLSVIDLSAAGRQPMTNHDETVWIAFNGEIYNYLELKTELQADYEFRTKTDTEVLLAAYLKWGKSCLDKLIGMFAFVIWDEREQTAFAARDRFGVKPLYYHQSESKVFIASEIKVLHAAGIRKELNSQTWANYFAFGLQDNSEQTFWQGVYSLPAGHYLTRQNGETKISRWYDLAERVGTEFDERPENVVQEEYFELMKESVRLRFRSDVPVGINLSGGVDSSCLLGVVRTVCSPNSNLRIFTFVTGDERYDELPWVEQMLLGTNNQLIVCPLNASEVPQLAADVQRFQDEPFGGLPTLAYAKIFAAARQNETIVLLDGNGMDEQWAGYDYYAAEQTAIVQGTSEKPVRPDCLLPEFRQIAVPLESPQVFPDRLRNLQYRDARLTKIPRAMRFNDRVAMRSSTELREPFLDHRLFELALRQPPERKISNGTNKKLLREITAQILPATNLAHAPKRAVQTPQREWLRTDLKDWAEEQISIALHHFGGIWLDKQKVLTEWQNFCDGAGDNSFFVWQWVSLGLIIKTHLTEK
jgi:asparagine synthase (glutamine-hydrolysing)